ncbi:MAG: helix-turn-helix domain containing protein [Flavobacterium sp. JAD_PAG50586_2]|nr:MAG: helix-turn-helix domain containing protein [Flavobacterium sp. JAD_PAG50586_2]
MQEKISPNASFILIKLKKALKISSDKQLSEFLNIKPNTISTWKKRNSVDYKIIISICELYEIDLNEIFYDDVNHFDKNKNYLTDTPLVCRESQFQYCVDSSSILYSLPKFNFPFIRSESSRVFQVLSNNMFPIIDENSFVICEEIEKEHIQENSLVVIVSKSKGLFINRIHRSQKSKDVYLLSSENSFFETIKLETAEINEIWLVKGILSYNVTNDNKSKIINDSLVVLDKALAKIKTDYTK